jgi:hypothetical protein
MRLRASAAVSHLYWMQVGDVFTAKLHSLIGAHERKLRAKNALVFAVD